MESNQHVRKQSILAWRAAVHGVTGSRARLNDFTFTFHFHALEKEMATHSSILAWRIPGTEEPSGLLSMGLHRVRHNWSNLAEAAAVAAGQVRKKNTVSVKQSCLTLCNPMDYNSPDSSLHGILQVWILECTAIPFSRASPHPGIDPESSTLQADSLQSEPTEKPRLIQRWPQTQSVEDSCVCYSDICSSKLMEKAK